MDNQKIIFAECKATNAKISLAQVEKWADEKIPAFRKWALRQETWRNRNLIFEYWATSGFEKDAEEKLLKISESANKFTIHYYNGDKIRAKAIKLRNKKLKEAINIFFLKTEL